MTPPSRSSRLTGPSEFNVQQQVSDTESLVAEGAKGIMLGAADPTALIPAVQEAKNAGIAVDAADTDTYGGDEQAGKYMCTLIGNKCQAAIKADCPAVQVVATEITNNDEATARADTTSLLAKYPRLARIFADNIVDAQGAVQGSTILGTARPKIVAFDAEPAKAQMLKQGQADALIAEQPALLGQYAAEGLLDAVAGKAVPQKNVNTILITPQTLAADEKYVYHS